MLNSNRQENNNPTKNNAYLDNLSINTSDLELEILEKKISSIKKDKLLKMDEDNKKNVVNKNKIHSNNTKNIKLDESFLKKKKKKKNLEKKLRHSNNSMNTNTSNKKEYIFFNDAVDEVY